MFTIPAIRNFLTPWALCCFAAGFCAPGAEGAERAGRADLLLKVDAELIPCIDAVSEGLASDASVTQGIIAARGRQPGAAQENRLSLTVDVPHISDDVLRKIAATGARIFHSSARWNSLELYASAGEIAALAGMPEVRLIHLAKRGHTRQAGVAPNQADGDMNADQARAATGVSGAGQKVGVISNSCNRTGIGPGTVTGSTPNAILSAMTNQQSGDLPAQIQVVDFGPADVVATDGDYADEGSAMMELIHDVAPNASLVFASGYDGQTVFAENILKLGKAGCTVTCDDVGYYEEPYFQDGPIAQAIAANFKLGIPHFAATGNDYSNGIAADYKPVNQSNTTDKGIRPPDGSDFHDWGIPGQPAGFLAIDIQPGRSLTPILQWNQPFQSYGLGPGASVDLDMYLFDAANPGAAVLAKSENVQFAGGVPGGDPLEEFNMGMGYVNNTAAVQRVYLAVNHFAGARDGTFFRIVIVDRTGFSFPFGGGGAISVYGHPASAQCIGCAAIYSAEIESGVGYGADSQHIHAEAFSSLGGSGAGGIPYFFDTSGNRLPGAPQRRDKPDISAVDGCTTSFFFHEFHAQLNGSYYPPLSNHFPSFFGTSAAAPNAAAVAALLKERASLSSPDQIKNVLQSTARLSVLNVPVTPPDRIGAGLIDAYAAILALPVVVSNPMDRIAAVSQNATFAVAASGAAVLSYQWQKNGVDIAGQTGTSLTLVNVQVGDDGSHFACIVSNSAGATASAAAVLHIDTAPVIASAPLADPAVARTGFPVSFTVGAAGAFGQPVVISWDFDDGATGTGAAASHVYAAPGIYTVTVAAADPLGLSSNASLTVTVYQDDNGDGFPDLNPEADNSGYADLVQLIQNLTPQRLDGVSLKIALDFSRPAQHDALVLKGRLPVPAGFQMPGQHVTVLVAGLGRSFTLDKKGSAVLAAHSSFRLYPGLKHGMADYVMVLSRETLKQFFAAAGLTDKTTKNEPDAVRVTIFFNGAMFDTMQPQIYSAIQGRFGKTK